MNVSPGEQIIDQYFFRVGSADSNNTGILTNRRLVFVYHAAEEYYPVSKITLLKIGFKRSYFMMVAAMLLVIFGVSWIATDFNVSESLAQIEKKLGLAPVQMEASVLEAVNPRDEGRFICPVVISIGLFVGYLGWRGRTMLVITTVAGTKAHKVMGKDVKLLKFGASVAHQLR